MFRALLRPRLRIRNLEELDVNTLKQMNIRAIGIDKDNVLAFPRETAIQPRVQECVSTLQAHFPLVVFSNSVGSGVDFTKGIFGNKKVDSIGTVPIVPHGTLKPAGGGILVKYFQTLLKSNVRPEEIAFIGDRVLTDMVFANFNGFLSILIDPLDPRKDPYLVQSLRRVENFLIR